MERDPGGLWCRAPVCGTGRTQRAQRVASSGCPAESQRCPKSQLWARLGAGQRLQTGRPHTGSSGEGPIPAEARGLGLQYPHSLDAVCPPKHGLAPTRENRVQEALEVGPLGRQLGDQGSALVKGQGGLLPRQTAMAEPGWSPPGFSSSVKCHSCTCSPHDAICHIVTQPGCSSSEVE